MSINSGPPSGTPRPSWKAEAEEQSVPVARRRWQVNWSDYEDEHFLKPMRRQRWKLGALTFLTVLLAAGFTYSLLFASIKTPLLAVIVSGVEWPHRVHAYTQEELEGLRALDGKTIRMWDGSNAWHTRQQALDNVRQVIRDSNPLAARSGVMVFYLSIPGM